MFLAIIHESTLRRARRPAIGFCHVSCSLLSGSLELAAHVTNHLVSFARCEQALYMRCGSHGQIAYAASALVRRAECGQHRSCVSAALGMWCMMSGSLQTVYECNGKRLRCPHQHLLVLISVSAATAFMLLLEHTMDISSVVLMFLWPGRLVWPATRNYQKLLIVFCGHSFPL